MSTPAGPSRVRFKYLLGELLFGDWRPLLQPVDAPESSSEPWPQLDQLPMGGLPGEVEGYHCRRAATGRFPRGISRQGPWLCYSPRQERLYYVELSGTFEDYLKRRSVKSRHNLKRSVKKLLGVSPDALEILTTDGQMPAFQREACEISRQTYQERLLGSGLPSTPEYLRSMEDKARRGEARGYLLRHQGQAIAFAWCTARGSVMVYEVIGYLPELAAFSPGTVLLYLIVQDLFGHGGYSLLDFGPGDAFYKAAFSTGSMEYSDVYLFRPSWRNRWRVWLHWRVERFSTATGAWLERIGLKKKIRMKMRSAVTLLRGEKAPGEGKSG